MAELTETSRVDQFTHDYCTQNCAFKRFRAKGDNRAFFFSTGSDAIVHYLRSTDFRLGKQSMLIYRPSCLNTGKLFTRFVVLCRSSVI